MAKQVDIRAGTKLEQGSDGNWTATFTPLDVTGTGSSEDDAMRSMVGKLQEALNDPSDDVKARFEAYAAENSVEMPDPDDLKARSKEATAGFPALDDGTFDQTVEGSDVPVLVDFWAEWCMPCHMIAPVIKEIYDDFGGRMTVAKLNMDEHPAIADRFGVRSIPTLILFKGGQEVHRIVGAGRPKEEYAKELEPYLG